MTHGVLQAAENTLGKMNSVFQGPSFLSVAAINTVTKSNLGRKGFTWVIPSDHNQELKKRPWGNATYSFAPWAHLQLPFLCLPGPPATGGTALSGLALSHQENALPRHYRHICEGNSSTEGPSSQMSPVCVKLARTSQRIREGPKGP